MPAPSLERRFFSLALINVLSNVTVPLAGLVDTAMLGHLPEIRFLAGVALASLLFDYVYWTFGFLRMGTTGTTATAVGAGDERQAHLTLYRSVLLGVIAAGAILLLRLPLREMGFAVLSGAPEVEEAGRSYFDARIWGAPATLVNFALIGWFLGREESRHVLVMTIAGNLANIGLNYLFIIRLGLAARGAGLATMLSQHVTLLVAVAILASGRHLVRRRWSEVLDRARLASLVRLNGEILVRTLCLVSAFAVFTNLSSILGTAVLAANAILMRLFSLAAYLIDGAAFACESLAGIMRGRRDLSGLRRLFRLGLATGLAAATLVLAATLAAPAAVFGALTSHDEIVRLGLDYVWWLAPVLLFGSLAFMYDGLFIGLTEGRVLRNGMLFSTLLVFAPVAFAAWRTGDNHLLWAAMAAFMLARTWTLWAAGRKLMVEFAGW